MNQKITLFEKVSFFIFLATIFLGTIAFIPSSLLSLASVKVFIFGIGILAALVCYTIARLKGKSIEIPYHPLILLAEFQILVILLSALFSQNPYASFFGKAFSADTAGFSILLFIGAFLAYVFGKNRKDTTLYVFTVIIATFVIAAIFHILRFFGGVDFLGFGVFSSITSTMLGSWFDFGILSGLTALISLTTFELLPLNNRLRIVFSVLFVLSMLLLVVVGISSVWFIFALATLLLVGYKYHLNQKENKAKKWLAHIPLFSIIVAVCALFFTFYGSAVSVPIIKKLNANYAEVSLPWQYTVDIAAPTIKESPLLGAGPSRFATQYMKYKPRAVNATQFWSVDFAAGQGYVLTSLVETGLLGFVTWLVLLVLFLRYGFKGLRHSPEDPVARYSFFASFVATFFLALALITYIPSHSILIITFVLAGLFVGELVRTHGGKHKMIEYKEKKGHRIGFTVILSLVILVSVVWVIMNIKQTAAQFYFGKSVAALNTSGSVDEASMLIKKALSLNATDVYYQAQAQIDMYAANQIISSASTTPDQTTVAKVGTLVSDSLTAARSAETFDPTNVYNFITEARVSELATTLAIPNAYENGKAAYLKAIQLSPLNPAVYLAYAKLEFYKGNTNVASDALSAALQLKPDYTDALFEAALMAYSAKSYDTAKSALDALIKIDPKYPNIDALGTAISAKISNPGTGVSAPSEPQVPASKQIKPVPAKH